MKIVDVKTYPTVYPVKQPFSNGMRTTRQRVARLREDGLEHMVHAVWPSTESDLAVVSS